MSVLLVLVVKWLSKEEEVLELEGDEPAVQEIQLNLKSDNSSFLEHLTDCFNITISSFGFLIGFYPMYDKIEPNKRTPKNGFFATFVALAATVFIYVSFS